MVTGVNIQAAPPPPGGPGGSTTAQAQPGGSQQLSNPGGLGGAPRATGGSTMRAALPQAAAAVAARPVPAQAQVTRVVPPPGLAAPQAPVHQQTVARQLQERRGLPPVRSPFGARVERRRSFAATFVPHPMFRPGALVNPFAGWRPANRVVLANPFRRVAPAA